jgi:hypothetical protein
VDVLPFEVAAREWEGSLRSVFKAFPRGMDEAALKFYGRRRKPDSTGTPARVLGAVRDGLDWLARHQNADGSWSGGEFMFHCRGGACRGSGAGHEFDTGVSALALLALLGAGHTHEEGLHRDAVLRGLRALIRRQTPDGCFGQKSADGRWIYNHAIATWVFAEAYGMGGKSPCLRHPAQKAVDFLIDCQNPYLGWRYGRQTGENDTSVTGWAVAALKAAKMSGLHVPKEAFDGALNWFNKVTDEAYYRTGYTAKNDEGPACWEETGPFIRQPTPSAVAAFCRILILGRKATNRPEVLGAGNILKTSPPESNAGHGTVDMVYWFWGSLAMYQLGRSYWKAWKIPIEVVVVSGQNGVGCAKGSWDPVGAWGAAGGRVYATALGVLILEAHSRYSHLLNVR